MPLLQKINIGGANNPVTGWTDQTAPATNYFANASANANYAANPGGTYDNALSFNGQANVAPEAVYRTLAYWLTTAASSFLISGLTPGNAYICRLHLYLPNGFTSGSHGWNANVNGGTNLPVTTSVGLVNVYEIAFTAAATTATLNYSVNTSGAYKATSAIEIIEAGAGGSDSRRGGMFF